MTRYAIQCYAPCKNPITPFNQCCPSCRACPLIDSVDGEEIEGIYPDPCIKCYCFKGQLICHRTEVCPVLPCPSSRWIKAPNSCCPKCDSGKLYFIFFLSPTRIHSQNMLREIIWNRRVLACFRTRSTSKVMQSRWISALAVYARLYTIRPT